MHESTFMHSLRKQNHLIARSQFSPPFHRWRVFCLLRLLLLCSKVPFTTWQTGSNGFDLRQSRPSLNRDQRFELSAFSSWTANRFEKGSIFIRDDFILAENLWKSLQPPAS